MRQDTKIGVAIGVLLVALVVIFWWAQQESASPIPPLTAEEASGVEGVTEPPAAPTGGSDAAIDVRAVLGGDQADAGGADLVDSLPGGDAGPGAPETVSGASQRVHVVGKEETLTSIARRYYGSGGEWRRIYDANRSVIPDPDRLSVGTRLVIPGVPGAAAPAGRAAPGNEGAAGPRRHTVKRGETLRSIARQYYGSEKEWTRILEANRGRISDDPKRLKIGVVLVIPPAPE